MPYSSTRTIELPCVVAGLLWAVSVTLFGVAMLLLYTSTWHTAAIAYGASLIIAGIACCASVRVMLIQHYRAIREAFDYGREVGQEEASRLPLQRVH